MRNDTRLALENLLEFLSDNSLAASVGVGLYDALNERPGAKSLASGGQAVQQVISNTETEGANAQGNLAEGTETDTEFPIEFIKEALRDPLSQVSQQFLAPQGIHHTFIQLKTLMDSVTESPLSEAIDLRLSGADQTEIVEKMSEGDDDSEETPEDEAAATESKVGNLALESMKGGFTVNGHSKTLGDGNPLRSSYPENIRSPDNESNPKKSKPAYTYCAFFDPMQPFARKEAALAAASATLIPTIEWSRAVPYFNLKILGPATSLPLYEDGVEGEVGQILRSELSIDQFFGGSVGGITEGSRFTDLPSEGPNSDRLVGMEAFTMPQSIIPTGKTPDRTVVGSYQSVDSTRPFMTIKDFSVSVTPTRGTSSSMRATLNIILHDRGRMPQLANLLKPATLNRYAFDIEWGWSHPAGSPISNNVYGQFINSLKTRQIFSLYATSYSFTPDGQVDIKCDLVTKGTNALNELDCGTTTVIAADTAVELALDAVKQAAKAVGLDPTQGIGDPTPVKKLSTLGPDSLGSLIDGEVASKLQELIDAGGSPNLETLGNLLDELIEAVGKASSVAQDNISKKITSLTAAPYSSYKVYTKGVADSGGGVGEADFLGDGVASGAWKTGTYVPLGAILEAFVVQPLFQTHQYDEIQMVTYTANLNAGGAAGANLGALPINMVNTGGPSMEEMLKEQVTEYGGQYPVSRFIRFLSQNFVELQQAPMYSVVDGGLSGMKVDENSGNLVPSKPDKNLAKKVKTKLLPIYYNSSTPSSAAEPRPTPFTPIKLKLIFDAAPSVPLDSLDDPPDPDPSDPLAAPRQVLRIHVVDAVAGSSSSQGWMQILKQARSAAAQGILVPPIPRQPPAGMSAAARLYSNLEANLLSCAQVCQWLSDNDILEPVAEEGSALAENITKIETLEATIDDRKSSLKIPDLTSEDRAQIQAELDEASANLAAAKQNRPVPQAYKAAIAGSKIIDLVSQTAPNLVWGREGSIATSITVKQKASDGAGTTYMMRALRGGEAGKTSPSRGLPMRVHSADVGVEMFGNPLVKYMQQFFVNTDSGTTIDNLYAVIGIEHKVTKDDFRTSISLAPQEAYGIFESLTDQTGKAIAAVERLKTIKSQQEHNANVMKANARLSEATALLTKSQKQLKDYTDLTNIVVREVFNAARIHVRSSIQKGTEVARARHGLTTLGRAEALSLFDQWLAGNTNSSAWFTKHLGVLGSLDGSLLTNWLYEVARAYERNINKLCGIGDPTSQSESLNKSVRTYCKTHGFAYGFANANDANIVIMNVMRHLITVGALPYWATGEGRGIAGTMPSSAYQNGRRVFVNASRHGASTTKVIYKDVSYYMTERFGAKLPTAAAAAAGSSSLYGATPGKQACPWYFNSVEFYNPGYGWYGPNYSSTSSYQLAGAATVDYSVSFPFYNTHGTTLNIYYVVPSSPPIGTPAECFSRRATLEGDVAAAKAALDNLTKAKNK